jgi:CRP-like cAMP-binding protein
MLLTQRIDSNLYSEINNEDLLLQFYEKGEEISLLDLGLWQVYRGVVQLSRINNAGKEVVVGWASNNSAFGNWLDIVSAYRAQALSDVYVKWHSPQDIARSPHIARILLGQLSQRLIRAEQFLTVTAIRRIDERLWETLMILKEDIGQTVDDGTQLKVRFTHQNLADAISTTRVTITKILGHFQDLDLISINVDHLITIKGSEYRTAD